MMMDITALQQQLAQYGQEHLLQFWDTLSESEQKDLLKDIHESVKTFYQFGFLHAVYLISMSMWWDHEFFFLQY